MPVPLSSVTFLSETMRNAVSFLRCEMIRSHQAQPRSDQTLSVGGANTADWRHTS